MAEAPPRWLNRLAGLTAAATLGLIAVGGLVTSTGSGMAFPDWPTSAGHGMLAYPWFRAARKAFIEHGHRLAGLTVGALTLALAFSLWARDGRRWVKELGLLAAASVYLQGRLGGLRVLLDQRTLAFLHACVAHAFFALMVVLSEVTSRRWAEAPPAVGTSGLKRLCLLGALLMYVQILLGAGVRQLGHPVLPHVILALGVVLLLCWTALKILRDQVELPVLSRPASALAALAVFQASLGLASWLSLRASPQSREAAGAVLHTVLHVVTGAALLGVATTLALRVRRFPS